MCCWKLVRSLCTERALSLCSSTFAVPSSEPSSCLVLPRLLARLPHLTKPAGLHLSPPSLAGSYWDHFCLWCLRITVLHCLLSRVMKIVSCILPIFFIVSGRKVNLNPVSPSCLKEEVDLHFNINEISLFFFFLVF